MSTNGNLRIFSGATAIVTGGASGIGRALSQELAKRGCEVVIADLQMEPAEEVVQGVLSLDGKASFIKADVSDFAAIDEVVKTTVERTGRLDYMFNNAGIGIGLDVRDHTREDWDRIIDVNLTGVVNGIQAAYPIMIRQGFGHLVNTSSIGGLKPTPGAVSYAATKAAVFQLSRSLRIEGEEYGVRVSVFCPGVIRTPILYGGKYGKLPREISRDQLEKMWDRLRPMDPDVFAADALNEVARNKAIIVLPAWWKLFWYMDRLSPKLSVYIDRKLYQKSKRELFGSLESGADAP
jgi:NAD(P)-dependent dehydrogenase (short-subunit alcohol dehydrogenase family)